MFAPTKTWRRWHRKINVTEKRHALASAISATAIPSLVMARGHRVDNVAEIPLVIDNKAVDNLDKTSKARALLTALKVNDDLTRVDDSRKVRTGRGKMRNRRHTQRRGPLVIYNAAGPLNKAFRNIPGVELANVNRLNLLQLAPGGHLGRFVIWTKDAFEALDTIYGTYRRSSIKAEYKIPRPLMINSDLNRIINSDEIQSAVRSKLRPKRHSPKRNALKNIKALVRLNPYAATERRRIAFVEEQSQKKRAAFLEAKRNGTKVVRSEEEKKAHANEKAKKKAARASTKKYRQSLLSK